jgi:phosphoribosylglycinamide formyltransferase 1
MADRSRVAVLVSGRGSNMAALVYAARAANCPYEIVLVTGDRPEAPGLALAEAEGIAVRPLDARTLGERYWGELESALNDAAVDTVALAGFMRIIPGDFLTRWAGKVVNIHPSLLPRHKGLKTHEAVLAAGESRTGATVHLVTPELDSGEILASVEVAVLPGDTAETLAARVLIAEHQLYPRTLAWYVARPFDSGWIEEQVEALASALPGVLRKTSHGSPGWAVGSEKSSKHFAILADRHHGEDAIGLLVRASGPDEMFALIEAMPELYYRPKYYGASGWIGLKLNQRDVDWAAVRDWLERSWAAAAPPRLAAGASSPTR